MNKYNMKELSSHMENWIKEYFKEQWVEDKPNIDFNKETPIKTSNSLHIYEERYQIDGITYRLLYPIGGDISEPLIEKLKQ